MSIKPRLTLVSSVLFLFFSCKKATEEKDVFSVTSDFDRSTIENKTYLLGDTDTVKADIHMKFAEPMNKVRSEYSIGTIGYIFEEVTVSVSATEFMYKFRFPLDPKKFNSSIPIYVNINSFYPQPKPNGAMGGAVTHFTINVK